MPELPELMIMSNFINHNSTKSYSAIILSEKTKNRINLNSLPKNFFIKSNFRGKELNIDISCPGFYNSLFLSMGMSGNFIISDNISKHSHLIFKREDNKFLCLEDPRRFARWKWAFEWSKNRGPCCITEFENFQFNLEHQLKIRKKIFQKFSISEILLNQKFFNGIGNYLRAEIIGRANINPFQNSFQYLTSHSSIPYHFTHLCRDVIIDFYNAGGGQIKDWKNPNNISNKEFEKTKKFYQNGESLIDKTGRRMWFNSKWKIKNS